MPAAGEAQVVARYLHPLVVLRSSQHPLQQLPVVGLQLALLPQRAASILDPRRKRVADGLQLAEVEHPPLARERRHLRRHLQTAKCLSHEPRQLGFEAADLAPQLGPSEALVASYPQCTPAVSFEQMRHTHSECS